MRNAIAAIAALALSLLPAGTVRAQSYVTLIDGPQAGTASPGTGMGTFTLDAANKMLSFDITFSGLVGTESAAHIHGPAPPGMGAGIQFPLPVGSPKIGSVGPLSPQQEGDLNAGLYYVNIHSSQYGQGEIRGQILVDTTPAEKSTWGAIKALYDR